MIHILKFHQDFGNIFAILSFFTHFLQDFKINLQIFFQHLAQLLVYILIFLKKLWSILIFFSRFQSSKQPFHGFFVSYSQKL